MVSPVLPGVHSLQGLERVLAGLHAVQQRAPRIPDVRPTDERSPAVDGPRMIRPQVLAERGERESPAVLFAQDPDARKSAKEPVERGRMSVDRESQVADLAWPVLQLIAD